VKVGFGIEVRENGQLIQVGSARFMALQGVAMPEAGDAQRQRCAAEGHSLVFVAVDGEITGAIELHSTVRPEAKQLIQRLHARGLQVHILSGDQEAPTRRLAAELGVEHYSANVLPEDKATRIEQLQTAGRSVCFVGDGINDAIALKKAHVSVSLRGATTVAIDAAQIVLLQQNLDPFVRLLEIATDLDATQRRSFDIMRGLRVALIGGVLLFSFDIYWSLVVLTAGLIGGLVNASLPIRKYETDLTPRVETSQS
jgi:Cu2+-exporting ATPase